jgi:hypothetical protein
LPIKATLVPTNGRRVMAENRQQTINRPDDRRQQTGYRVLFDRATETAAWSLAKAKKGGA